MADSPPSPFPATASESQPTLALRLGSTDTLASASVRPSGGLSIAPVNPVVAPAGGDFEARYRAKGSLGQGGMGEVRLCHDQQIGRDVAVKVVRPELLRRQDAIARFVREARVQGQLEHPAIVPVHDLGVTSDGAAFFTMKRVRGVTLADVVHRIRDGDEELEARLSQRKLLSALVSVALAVDFAHKRGVLHRDLKPSNVMIGDFGEVYVLDWGIAKVGADEAEDVAALEEEDTQIGDPVALATRAGDVLGTPGYMAPEQIEGRRLDARSDVYALGAILFEVLARMPLHPGSSPAKVIASTLGDTRRCPSELRPDLDIAPELDAICARATARRREDRYASARELSDAIDSFLEGDRDVELRRDMAAAHVRKAEEALARSLKGGAGSEAAQAETMRELGRALALDPSNTAARDALRRALLDVPDEPPAQVLTALREREDSTLRLGARLGTYQLVLYFAFAPIVFAMGVTDFVPFIFPSVCLAIGLAVVVYERRVSSTVRPWAQVVTLAGMVLAMASLTRAFSPLVLVPTLLATNAAVLQIHPWQRMRSFVLGMCLTAAAVPMALELAGVLPRTFWFAGDTIVIKTPGALREIPSVLFFVLAAATLIASPALFIGAIRRALSAAEMKVEMNAWRARLLAPEAAIDVQSARSSRTSRAGRRRSTPRPP